MDPYGFDLCFEFVLFSAYYPILPAPFVAEEDVVESFYSDDVLELSDKADPFLVGDYDYEVELDVSFKTANSYIPSCGSP